MSTQIKVVARVNGAEENKYAVKTDDAASAIAASQAARTALVDALIADTVELTKLRDAIDALPV